MDLKTLNHARMMAIVDRILSRHKFMYNPENYIPYTGSSMLEVIPNIDSN